MNKKEKVQFEGMMAEIEQLGYLIAEFDTKFNVKAISENAEESIPYLQERLSLIVEHLGKYSTKLNHGQIDPAATNLAETTFVLLETLWIMRDVGTAALKRVIDANGELVDNSNSKLNEFKTRVIK
jgi:hypothetical protein